MFVTPCKANKMNSDMKKGITSEYAQFINSVLKTIRKENGIDYCFYIYQIMKLLEFHHDDLRTRYCNGYWEVWLCSQNCK